MGYTTSTKCYEDLNMKQSPRAVFEVRDRAGWTYDEAAEAIKADRSVIASAEQGYRPMPDAMWREFLLKAGQRVFDDEA